ncbi:helix-turn-helix domain-containing protein [Phascolarctobacterium succinatutens]|uniref:helix-turn-helix domain-containing protein n=1 Tax=Phascolarctobacterium succinatutens TaxID=626940 RepID=UPI0023F3AE1C|nr:helix-turn-helix transcriptional regulator [Phascolarctobacterium succinatutens]
MTTFSDRLRYFMEQKGLKQADLVERTKINKSSISEYLSGNYEPKQRNIYKLAVALGIKPSQLMGVEEDQPAAPATTANAMELSEREILLIKKYRQLDADGQEDVEDFVSMKLAKAQRKAEEAMTAEEKEEALG